MKKFHLTDSCPVVNLAAIMNQEVRKLKSELEDFKRKVTEDARNCQTILDSVCRRLDLLETRVDSLEILKRER